ncbi:hypothetical protein BO86DRAFT_394645 [Aspergillus japonicus CBS 114.51]|nr:hypothetical protein BO86DRAFT_394645 [Aspergillus japonicus CBS 114.51]RAH86849.1 hypothetical protein BO86DRAFT_394645 [Aspergillus japonicus CBS 114.51]
MPWRKRKCQYCQKIYWSDRLLREHLRKYVGEWRLPADGIHDFSEITQILRQPRQISYEAADYLIHKCWTCAKVIQSRRRFIEHVAHQRHCGFTYKFKGATYRPRRAWPFKFSEESMLIREKTFPFLRLPTELRLMVYEHLLCFKEIVIHHYRSHNHYISWLQHNPSKNALAIMAVNRRIYEEARLIFYRLNTFTFSFFDALPIFLIGIGDKNAKLLQRVRCRKVHTGMKYTDITKSCLRDIYMTGQTPPRADLALQSVADPLMSRGYDDDELVAWCATGNYRLFPANILRACDGPPQKCFRLKVSLQQDLVDRRTLPRQVTASYELYLRKNQEGA